MSSLDPYLKLRVQRVLSRRDVIEAMQAASDAGRPAAEPTGDVLLREVGPVVREYPVRQMVGRLIKEIMESNGYVWWKSGVKTPENSVFSNASVYRRRGA